MKLGYYHYYFKQRGKRNAPRICHNMGPLLKAYTEYDNIDWKTKLESEDGEKLFLTPTGSSGVYMLAATRHQEREAAAAERRSQHRFSPIVCNRARALLP